MSQLDVVIKEMAKKYGDDIASYGVARTEYDKIPFTSPRLNYMCYGGLPVGRIYEFAGPESSGKTSTAFDIIHQAQLKYKDTEKRVVFVDIEGTYDEVWASKFGVDSSKVLIVTPKTLPAEDVLTLCRNILDSDEVSLMVIDSIATLVPGQLMGTDMSQKAYGGIAIPLTRFVNEVKGLLQAHNSTLICINQVREDLNSMFGGTITPGGRAFKHACSGRFEFRKGKFIDKDGKELTNNAENPAGNLVHMVVKKSKVFRSDRRVGYYTLSYLEGPQIYSDYIDVGLQVGVINQRGAYFDIVDTSTGEILNTEKIQGRTKLRDMLKQNPEWIKLIDNAMNDKSVEEVVDANILADANKLVNTAKDE